MFRKPKKDHILIHAASRTLGEFNIICKADEWADKIAELMAEDLATTGAPVVIRDLHPITKAEYEALKKAREAQREHVVKHSHIN